MFESNPAGVKTCDACGMKDSPTITHDDGAVRLTVCDDCREPYEAAGMGTMAASEHAYTDSLGSLRERSKFLGGVAKRLAVQYGLHLVESDGQRLAFDVEQLEERESQREEQRREWRESKMRQRLSAAA